MRDEDEIDLAPDGAYVTVPNSADYVYTDGEDVIWSNTAFYDPGPGYDQIN